MGPASSSSASHQGGRRAIALLSALARRINRGSLVIAFPDGTRQRFAGRHPGPHAVLYLRHPRMVRRLVLGGSLGMAESYLDGDWDSPDLTALLELGALNETALENTLTGKSWVRWGAHLLHRLKPNSKRGSRRNIAYHYDLGNAFYRRWLDPSMTYSAALFSQPNQPLEEAQANKYRRIVEIGNIRPHHHVLEIGCGWGGFASFAAREIGCRVTAITISEEQFAHAKRRIHEEGLAEKVVIDRRDYRDVEGRFDRVASIEMFEAVGERYWPRFFAKVHDLLVPGGSAALQIITIADHFFDSYRRGADFIQRYIFPGGMLPSPSALAAEARRANLAWRADMGFGADYARTLAEWQRRFQAAWPEIATLGFDQRFKRMWEYYLAYCEAGFRTATIDVVQLELARP